MKRIFFILSIISFSNSFAQICVGTIGPNAIIENEANVSIGGSFGEHWICPSSNLVDVSSDNNRIFVEDNGNQLIISGNNNVIYIKGNVSLEISGNTNTVYMAQGNINTSGDANTIYTQSSTVTFSGNVNTVHGGIVSISTDSGTGNVVTTLNPCSSVSFDYNLAPPSGCQNVGVNEKHIDQDVIVYPNPTKSDISIDLGESTNAVTIRITDINGRLVHHAELNSIQILNVDLTGPSGIYFLTVHSAERIANIRLVKQ